MRKQITYFEPYFDPYTHKYDHSNLTRYDIIANTEEEYNSTMTAITNPSRGITDITIHDVTGDISGLGIDVNLIRQWRDEEFKLIDKYQLTLVFESLTPAQKSELTAYRQAWLDAPETMVIPETPEWIK